MTAGQQRLYKRTWSAAGSFTSTDINYYINADCQEGGIPAHTTSVKNIGPFSLFFFFFRCQQKETSVRCVLQAAPHCCTPPSCLLAATGTPKSNTCQEQAKPAGLSAGQLE